MQYIFEFNDGHLIERINYFIIVAYDGGNNVHRDYRRFEGRLVRENRIQRFDIFICLARSFGCELHF